MVALHDGFPTFEWELYKFSVVTGLIVEVFLLVFFICNTV